MIYTITLNPAIDYFIEVDSNLDDHKINRANRTSFRSGGKGVNVSQTLDTLEIESNAIVLLGGFSGDYIKSEMNKLAYCTLNQIKTEEQTRINVKLDVNDVKYSINAKGAVATDEIKNEILNHLIDLSENDYVMLCGARIEGITDEWLIKFAQYVNKSGAKLVLDMEQNDLDLIEAIKPYLIKPNLNELKILMGKPIDSDICIYDAFDELQYRGVHTILLSLGEDGAILFSDSNHLSVKQEIIHNENDVGMGDAMLGVFIGKLSDGHTEFNALKYAAAAGSATANSKSKISKDDIDNELINIKVIDEKALAQSAYINR